MMLMKKRSMKNGLTVMRRSRKDGVYVAAKIWVWGRRTCRKKIHERVTAVSSNSILKSLLDSWGAFEVLRAVNETEKVEEVAPEIIASAREVQEKKEIYAPYNIPHLLNLFAGCSYLYYFSYALMVD